MYLPHLSPDEVQFECLFRGIDHTLPNVQNLITSSIDSAASVNYHAVWQGRRLNDEVQIVIDRTEIEQSQLKRATAEGDLPLLEKVETKLLHLLNRVSVINFFSPELPTIARIREQLEKLVDGVREAIKAISGPPPEQIQNPYAIEAIMTDITEAVSSNVATTHATGAVQRTNTVSDNNGQGWSRRNDNNRQNGASNILDRRNYTNSNRSNYNANRGSFQSVNQIQSGSNAVSNNVSSPPQSNSWRSNLPVANVANRSGEYHLGYRSPNNNNQIPMVPGTPVDARATATFGPRVRNPISTWTIKFDGTDSTLSVEEFIFRVELMAEGEGITEMSLAAGLHYLLIGNALTWFWLFKRRHRQVTWQDLQAALKTEFRSQESDYEIRQRIDSIKQGPKEPFVEFRLVIESLLARLRNQVSETERVAILRRNMKPELRKELLFQNARNTAELTDLVRKSERLSNQLGLNQSQSIRNRGINEVFQADGQHETTNFIPNEVAYPINHSGEYIPFPIDANVHEVTHESNTTYMVCWNCRDLGHSFKNCTKSIPNGNIFCFGCGAPGILKPNCLKCRQAPNRRPNLMVPGNRVSAARQGPAQGGIGLIKRQWQ